MATLKIYTEDLQIAKALIKRDESITKRYFYQDCYPLFKSIYDNYYTDCTCCKEFIDEIYIVTLAPNKSGKCQMENYRGESTLTSWLKSVCLFYVYKRFNLKKRVPTVSPLPSSLEKEYDDTDSLIDKLGSSDIDFSNMNRSDAEALLNLMPNKRYRNIIRLRYLEQKTNEETAEALGMTMENYYNKHKLAKAQYEKVCRKEEHHG